MSIRLPRSVWLNLVQIFVAGALVLALIFPLEHALGRIFEADGQLEAATRYYQSWNKKHPNDYESRWHTAELLLATVNPAQALLEMESMAADWPGDPKVLERLVEIEDSLLHVRQVIPRLEALAEVVPDDVEVLQRLCDHYRWFGDTEKLIETLGTLVRLSDLPDERAEFLEILLANRRYEEIIKFYIAYMDTMPNEYEARLALYEAYVRTGRLDIAIVELERAFAIDPSKVEVLEELRDQLMLQGRWQDAIALYRDRLATDPGNAKLRSELSEMYQITSDQFATSGETDLARAQFRRRIELAPSDLSLRLEFAGMFAGREEGAVAIAEIESLLKEDGNHPGAWLALAERHSWANHPSDAARAYGKVHAQSPNDLAVRRKLASHLVWAERGEEAIEHYRIILKTGGNLADRTTLVDLLLDKNLASEAYRLAKPLLSAPTARNRQLFAFAAAGAGQCQEALPQLSWITSRQPENRDAWESLYDCATLEKDPAKALRAVRALKRLKGKTK